MSKLKPCPFCGPEAAEPVFIGNDHTRRRKVTIRCKAPGCTQGVTVGAVRFSHEWCHAEAVEKWNTRTVDDELAAAKARIAELEGLSPAEYRRQFMGDFTPSRRKVELYKRLAGYYLSTPDHVSNRVAGALYREFLSWAKACGYSQREINQAKGIVAHNPSGYVEVPDELVEGE